MRLKKFLVAILVLAVIYAIVFSPYGLVKVAQLKVHIWKSEEEIRVMETRQVLLRYELRLLETDQEYVKKIGAEKFGLTVPGGQ